LIVSKTFFLPFSFSFFSFPFSFSRRHWEKCRSFWDTIVSHFKEYYKIKVSPLKSLNPNNSYQSTLSFFKFVIFSLKEYKSLRRKIKLIKLWQHGRLVSSVLGGSGPNLGKSVIFCSSFDCHLEGGFCSMLHFNGATTFHVGTLRHNHSKTWF
jgi:hypothetical protein